MSITCLLCNQIFEKIIPWQHLKIHNISTVDYKSTYGEVYSPETRQKMANKIPHNKGKKVTDLAHKENIKQAMIDREERFRNGEFKRGKARTAEQKQHLSQKQSRYALNHPDLMKARTAKAIQTKKDRGYDFGSAMRGKCHSDLTKEKISTALQSITTKRVSNSIAGVIENMSIAGLTLLSESLQQSSIQVKCNQCAAEFHITKQYFFPSKFKKEVCPTCFPRTINRSAGEVELYNFIKTIALDAIPGYRESYHSKELDIYIPSMQIGFEYNGLYWHSESVLHSNNRNATSDYEKSQFFKNKGIQVISIFEDEWQNKQEIVKSRIKNILGKTQTVIYARKCIIKEVSSKDASDFCNTHHIMGKGRSNIRLGLYYNNALVSLMTFSNSNLSRKVTTWEINRFASIINTTVVGGASRLFKKFIENIDPSEVISYADNRWSSGDLYKQLGFSQINTGTPNYWYVQANNPNRIHRFTLRKNKNDNQSLTEFDNRKAQGYDRIWDCGSSKWVWSKK